MSVLSMLSELLERGLEVGRDGLILLQLFALGVDDALGRLGDELGVVQFGLHAANFVLRTGKLARTNGRAPAQRQSSLPLGYTALRCR